MPNSNYVLTYAGHDFLLTSSDGETLKTAISRAENKVFFWRFVPAGEGEHVQITIGAGIPLILRVAPIQ
ncbi:hypothetical protein B7R22_17010 [Subtercola boreus]|uniref:Uncharacterized protein n=1 Tax=Subtercola boreus TaxID=120213 RepID=A0A3E0VRE0_9MICO|nr:hypothetical protein [Subtercola boreus]RFA12130.1 hypothetical protein B7R22_17010 [Subtercola boreus]